MIIAGLWTGTDLADQKGIGLEPNEAATQALRDRLREVAGVTSDAPVDVVVAATYEALSDAPCMLLTAGLDDALGVQERPNMPGTLDEWPNWRIALPMPLEEIETDPRPRAVAAALDRRRDSS